jgi:alkylated DNA repair dioxygenase AlkB
VSEQFAFFDADPRYPEGFRYQPELISRADEEILIEQLRTLPFRDFEFHGFTGKRRVVSYGWKYDFAARQLDKVDDVPPFLFPIRERAAAFAGVQPAELQHALVTEYDTGAAIGWHRDKAEFGIVVGISLLSACAFRLRRKLANGKWERFTLTAQPRSAYLMSGPSRTEWEHSIPGVDALRYSITFRNFRADAEQIGRE